MTTPFGGAVEESSLRSRTTPVGIEINRPSYGLVWKSMATPNAQKTASIGLGRRSIRGSAPTTAAPPIAARLPPQ